MTCIAARMDASLTAQGFHLTAEQSRTLRAGVRLPAGLRLALTVADLAARSAVMILALVPIGALGGWTARHPSGALWNHSLRHLTGAPPLPPDPRARRHTFKLAAVWLLGASLLAALGQSTIMLRSGRAGRRLRPGHRHQFPHSFRPARGVAATAGHKNHPMSTQITGGAMSATVNAYELAAKVKEVYRQVAEKPHVTYHFELGRPLALRLGYAADLLGKIPESSVESFAGVGFFFDLAGLSEGETVLDLGSGSGTDAFYAARLVGNSGRVVGIDFTAEQLSKACRATAEAGLGQVEFREGRIESLPADDDSIDCVISNGVINLSPDKERVFAEAARVLRPGGRLALADIVSERNLADSITADAGLWASCIGGAAQQDEYHQAIEKAGLRITTTRRNPYEFISAQARNASGTYGVKSISLLATKPGEPPGHAHL